MKLLTISKKYTIDLSPPSVLAIGFLLLMLFGALLLKLPFATQHSITWIEALFTAASAVTITGLVVVDTGTTFSMFGQLIITALIQAGGLGFVTFAVLAAMSLGGRLGIGQKALAQEALGQTSLSKVGQVAKAVFFYSFFFEFLGFILLTLTWQAEFGLLKAAYYGFFHTISAFNNAGFALFSDSMSSYVGHGWIKLIISALYIIGGIGFVVLMDIRQQQRWQKLQTNTKIMLSATLVINLIAFVLIWLLESHNPATLASLSAKDQALAAWFQATVPRSSGFNSIQTGEMTDASTVLTLLLMFIGGGSLSTAGGIKLGTFVVLLLATRAFLRRQDEVRVFNRSIGQSQVMKALAVTSVTMMMIFMGIFTISAIEHDADFLDVAFEVVSAVCTVGLSRGLTAELSPISQSLLIFMMFAGRLGPLTLAYFIATPNKSRIQYPSTHIQIG